MRRLTIAFLGATAATAASGIFWFSEIDRRIADVGPSHHSEAVLFARSRLSGRSLQGEPACTGGTSWSTKAWRYGFSTRLMSATMGLRRLELADRIAAAAGEGWPTCEKHFSRSDDEGKARFWSAGAEGNQKLFLFPRSRS